MNSLSGRRRGFDDGRNGPIRRVIKVLQELNSREGARVQLSFYMLENSSACENKEQDGSSYADKIGSELRVALPGHMFFPLCRHRCLSNHLLATSAASAHAGSGPPYEELVPLCYMFPNGVMLQSIFLDTKPQRRYAITLLLSYSPKGAHIVTTNLTPRLRARARGLL